MEFSSFREFGLGSFLVIARAGTVAVIMAGLAVATRVSQRWGALKD